MDNKFFTFINPFLAYIDKGDFFRKPFSWLYIIIGIANLLAPLFILIQSVRDDIFDAPGKVIFVFIIIWVIMAFAGWLSFQLWWDRKSKVTTTSTEGDEFIATPVFSHFIQTLGEWLGGYIAIVGFFFAFFTTIILSSDPYYLRNLSYGILDSGWIAMLLFPIYGFLIIVFSRFLAEQFRALACIANNTRKTDKT